MAGKFELYKDKAGKFRFNLTAGNNQVIGTSQSYSSESGRDNGIQSVGKAAAGAKVDDQT